MSDTKVISIRQHKELPNLPQYTYVRGKQVNWGKQNTFPYQLLDLVNQSSVQQSIINMIATYILGRGIRQEPNKPQQQPNVTDSWNELLERVIFDYVTFGGFQLQIVPNKGGKTYSIYHQDISTVRVYKFDEYDKVIEYAIHYDWTQTGKIKPVIIPAFTGHENLKDAAQLYVYLDYKPANKWYPIPSYFQAIKYIKQDVEIQKYHNAIISNGFTPSQIIAFKNNPTEEEKEDIRAKLKDNFTGAEKAGDIVLMFGLDKEELPEIMPFETDLNADTFNDINEIIFQKIISAFNLSSPTLAGIAMPGKLGQTDFMVESYILFNETKIKQLRDKVLRQINYLKQSDISIEDFGLEDIIAKKDSGKTSAGTDKEKELITE